MNFRRCFKFECYYYCVNCFLPLVYIHTLENSIYYFYIKDSEETYKTGIILCNKCILKYYGKELKDFCRQVGIDDINEKGFVVKQNKNNKNNN